MKLPQISCPSSVLVKNQVNAAIAAATPVTIAPIGLALIASPSARTPRAAMPTGPFILVSASPAAFAFSFMIRVALPKEESPGAA